MIPPHAPLHILTYASSLAGGGVERAMLRLATGWREAGHRVTLVLAGTDGPLSAEIPERITIVRIDAGHAGLHRALPGIVADRAPDVLFCPGNHYTSCAAWTRLRLGRDCPPTVGKVSNRLDRGDQGALVGWGYRRWLRAHPRFLDRMVAMTPAMAAETVRMTGIDPVRVAVIANPPVAAVAGTNAGPTMPKERYLIGVGRLAPQKRWDRVIAALPDLAARDVALIVLGEGSERAALEAQVAALGLGGRVALPGHAVDPRPALAGAAVAVLASDYEGVPGVLREALAVGTPVVATDSSVAIAEIVARPDLGTVVPPGDHDALVAALDHWLEPGRARPEPVPEQGADSVARYLALFAGLVAVRRRPA